MSTSRASGFNFPVKTVQTSNNDFSPAPWDTSVCAACVSELDCRAKDEFCNVQGCCQKGECLGDEQCDAMFSSDAYYRLPGFESFGYDLNPMHPQDNEAVLRIACDTNPQCVAYTSYGMLKYKLAPVSAWVSQPPIPGLVPWVMYIKKSGKTPIKTFCSFDATTINNPVEENERNIKGLCRQCLACTSDEECPSSQVCETGCCLNNPCYVATPEGGEWVDGHYARTPQCSCEHGEKYCCLSSSSNIYSAYCSEKPCSTQDRVAACSYICEDPKKQFDAVMCLANQRCCNAGSGQPTCCSPGSDCGKEANECVSGQEMTTCKGTPPFPDVACFKGQLCCNGNHNAPPVCCNDPSAGCYIGKEQSNGCNFSRRDV